MFKRPSKPSRDEEAPRQALEISSFSAASAPAPKQKSSEKLLPDLDEDLVRKSLSRRKSPGNKKPKAPKAEGRRDSAQGKRVKPMTPSRIKNISEFYVAQREASAGMLREMLHRRALPWLNSMLDEERYPAEEEFKESVEGEISRLIGLGFINDRRYAEMKARSWRSAGRGARRIAMDLSKKGIDQDVIQDAIRSADAELVSTSIEQSDMASVESEFAAAETLAIRKRIGRFRTKPSPEDRSEKLKLWRREAGVLARAGFGLDVIRQVLDEEPDGYE